MDKKQTRAVIAALASHFAIIATGALVHQASFAAFTATASNDDNSWGTSAAITLTANAGPASSLQMYAAAPAPANPADELADPVTTRVFATPRSSARTPARGESEAASRATATSSPTTA